MTAYYNEIDPYAAQWLRNLADAGHVAPGHIDDRSIADVEAQDIGDGQAHFFAGIGGWSYALRLAGVPDDARVWTGSCPCQPFSTAGRGRGADDERHLWPVWYRLIAECRPPVVFGEQVASRAGREWFSAVRADLENLGYAVGGADLCAASIGAPHIRQRLWWVAYDDDFGRAGLEASRVRLRQSGCDADGRGDDGGVDDATGSRCEPARSRQPEEQEGRRGMFGVGREGVHYVRLGHPHRVGTGRNARTGARPEAPSSGCRVVARRDGYGAGASGAAGGMGHGIGLRLEGHAGDGYGDGGRAQAPRPAAPTGPWSDVEWVDCADGKRRPVEPGTFPLAHGVSGRMAVARSAGQPAAADEENGVRWYNRIGALRGFGNAIMPQLAAAFIVSALEAIQEANP